jgi:trigger factor
MEDTITHSNEFANELVHCTMHLKPKCVVDWTVKASAELIKKTKARSTKEIAKQVAAPGFRKGKCPIDIVTSRYANEIEKHTQELLIPAAYKACQSLSPIPNIDDEGRFRCKVQSFSENEATLLFSFETTPQVPAIDVSGFSLAPINRPEITEEKIAEAIRQALFFYASWKPITDRPIQEGDFVLLNVDVIDEGITPFSVFSNTRFEVKPSGMSQWMLDAVLGKKEGEQVEATSVADADASEEEKLIFKPRKVRISIEKVEEGVLPELTEELLSKMGASSEQDLKEKVSNQLNHQADDFVNNESQKQVWTYLLETFEIPETFVNRELSFRTQNLAKAEGFLDEWKSLSEEEKQNLMKLLISRSEQSVRLSILCNTLLRQAKIPAPKTRDSMQYAELMLAQAAHYVLNTLKQPATTTVE